jgi:tetratricopeptide (TPR) repeat protein
MSHLARGPDRPLEGVAASRLTNRAEALGWFRAEQQTLPRVLAWAADLRLDSQVVQLRTSMEGHARIRDLPEANEIMLAAARRLSDHRAIADSHFFASRLAVLSGAYDVADSHLERTLEHATIAGDMNRQSWAHNGLGSAADRLGHDAAALQHHRQAVELARGSGDSDREALNLSYLGYQEVRAGNTEQGLLKVQDAVERLRAIGEGWMLTVALGHLGMAYQIAGRPAEAIPHLRQAAASFQAVGDGYFEAYILMWLGDAYLADGDTDGARGAWQRALGLYRSLLPSHPDVDKIRAKLRQADARQ